MKHVVLYSGGPDSLITLAKVRQAYGPKDVASVYCDLSHKYGEAEFKAISETEPLTAIVTSLMSLGELERHDAFIPARNAYLCLAAARYLDGERGIIWLTVQKDELDLSDRSPLFLQRMSDLMGVLYPGAAVTTPWIEMDKTQMVRWYLDAGQGVEALRKTWSCYKGQYPVQCGDCPACVRRYIAFSINGIEEEYAQDPRDSPTGKDYVARAWKGTYSPARNQRILAALGDRSHD